MTPRPTTRQLLARIRALETDRRLLLEVASPQGRAVIRAARRWYQEWSRPDWVRHADKVNSAFESLKRACARLEKKGKRP